MEYYNLKKQYVETGIFQTISGDYTGYVSLLSGVPYVYNTSAELSILPTYNGDLLTSTYFRDRDINEDINLPYGENDIIIQPNDYLTADLINDKFNKVRENNIYLYSRMFMANNDLPVSNNLFYFGISSTNDTAFSKYNNYSPTIPFFNSANYGYLSGVVDYTAALNVEVPNTFSIFAITDNSFISLTGNNDELNIVERSYFIESTENVLPFNKLSNICRYENFIYITDYGNDIIYKYDIGGYYNNDSVIKNKRNYLEALGGRGTARDKSKFNGPKQITTNGKRLLIYDSNNFIIKIYDLNFNYIDKITNIPFTRTPVAAMEFSPYFDLLYVVTYSGSGLKLHILETDCYTIVDTVDYSVVLDRGELVKNIEFSKNNSNYYYICTTSEVYKFFVSKPTTLIGRYSENKLFNNIRATRTALSSLPEVTEVDYSSNLWSNQGSITYYNANWEWRAAPVSYTVFTGGGTVSFLQTSMQNDKFSAGMRLIETSQNYDKGLLFTGARLYVYDEPNLYKKAIKTDNLENFGKEDMGILGTDYIHTTAINREFYKLLRDVFAIKNNIVGRFSGEYDYTGVLRLTDYNYNIDFSDFNLLAQENYFINDNEKNIIGVINRPILNILKLQTQLLQLTKIDNENIRPVINSQNIPYTNVFIL